MDVPKRHSVGQIPAYDLSLEIDASLVVPAA